MSSPGPAWLVGILVATGALPLAACGTSTSAKTGTLVGRLTVEDGEPIDGATITAHGPARTEAQVVFSDKSGGYLVTDLPSGTYDVELMIYDFHVSVHGVVIRAGRRATLDHVFAQPDLEKTETVDIAAPPAR